LATCRQRIQRLALFKQRIHGSRNSPMPEQASVHEEPGAAAVNTSSGVLERRFMRTALRLWQTQALQEKAQRQEMELARHRLEVGGDEELMLRVVLAAGRVGCMRSFHNQFKLQLAAAIGVSPQAIIICDVREDPVAIDLQVTDAGGRDPLAPDCLSSLRKAVCEGSITFATCELASSPVTSLSLLISDSFGVYHSVPLEQPSDERGTALGAQAISPAVVSDGNMINFEENATYGFEEDAGDAVQCPTYDQPQYWGLEVNDLAEFYSPSARI